MTSCIKAFIRFDPDGYFAECLEVDATAHAGSLDETLAILKDEVCRCLDGKDLATLGLEPDPMLFITLEDVPLGRLNACGRPGA